MIGHPRLCVGVVCANTAAVDHIVAIRVWTHQQYSTLNLFALAECQTCLTVVRVALERWERGGWRAAALTAVPRFAAKSPSPAKEASPTKTKVAKTAGKKKLTKVALFSVAFFPLSSRGVGLGLPASSLRFGCSV